MNNADRILTVLSGVSTPVVALLVDTGTVSKGVGVDIGAIVVAVVASWHASAYVQNRRVTFSNRADNPIGASPPQTPERTGT